MPGIPERLAAVRTSMVEACGRAGRDPAAVRLVAVSKTVPMERILEAHGAGQVVFGESRQQEAAPKVAALPDDIEWHFIGKLQRNKVRKVLPDFSCLHGVDSMKLAQAIDRVAGELELRPKLFLEVNLAGEESKGGFAPEALLAGMEELVGLPNVEMLGLMVIPPVANVREWFAKARKLKDQAEERAGIPLPELSMGMSGDYEVAIEEGSTLVRVGSAIFGERAYSV